MEQHLNRMPTAESADAKMSKWLEIVEQMVRENIQPSLYSE